MHPGRRMYRLVGVSLFSAVLCALLMPYFFLPVANPVLAVPDVVRVQPGASTRQIAEELQARGLIRDANAFVLVSRLLRLDSSLKAGDYELSPGMNLFAVLRRLQRGEVATVRVTIPEGRNAREIAALLERAGIADRERFLAAVFDGRPAVEHFLPFAIPISSLEGYLYPDTYFFPLSLTEEEIVSRMVARFVQEAYPVIAAGRDALGLEVHEIVTLASIVEKEALLNDERPIIAGVFLNRLRLNMPLQADPTVQYVLERPRRRLSYRDIAIDSPYNTYRYRGLPPGPIASPGLASLRAVLEPADVPYLYFVAAGDGTHIFSETFTEHVAARRRVGW